MNIFENLCPAQFREHLGTNANASDLYCEAAGQGTATSVQLLDAARRRPTLQNLGDVIHLLCWSSACTQVTAGNVAARSNFTLTAQYFDTFVREQAGLFDANDNPIPQWTLTDLITNQNVFRPGGPRGVALRFARCSPPIAEAADEGPAAPDRSY